MAATSAAPEDSPLGVFGAEVRHQRERTCLSQRELGRKISYSEQAVGMIEAGRRKPVLDFAQRCDDVFGTDGLFERLWTLVRNANPQGWFAEYLEAETRALTLRIWEPEWMPGPFQTEAYAREVIAAYQTHQDDEIEERVSRRLERQESLLRPGGPDIWMLIGEGAVRRQVGGFEVWRKQLMHFATTMKSQRRWVVQVLPFAAGAHALSDGALSIVSFADSPDLVYADGPGVGLLVDRAEEVRDCRFRFDHDRTRALNPAESLAFINDLIEDEQ